MPRLRSPYDEDRHVPWLGRDVAPEEVVDVPAEYLPHFLAAGWSEVDKPRAVRKAAPETVTEA